MQEKKRGADVPDVAATLYAPADVWIISACTCAREGLKVILQEAGSLYRTITSLTGQEAPQDIVEMAKKHRPDVMVVWLPALSNPQRSIVRQLVAVLRAVTVLPKIVVQGEGALYWLWLTLMREVRNPALQACLHLLDAQLTVNAIRRHLTFQLSIGLMKMHFPEVMRSTTPQQLSVREVRVLLGSLSGASMVVLGKRLGVSPKTLYTQRMQALEKLGLETTTSPFWLRHLGLLLFECAGMPNYEKIVRGVAVAGDRQHALECSAIVK